MKIIEKLKEQRKPFVSTEFFPPADEAALKDFYVNVDKLSALNPLFASVTYGAGGGKQDRTLDIVTHLSRMGFCVMSHLTCVNARVQGLAEYLSRLQDVGVENVLALRGDPPRGQVWNWDGPFKHASDLVRYIRLQAGDMGIAVAGYPCPHPQSVTYADDRAYTLAKIRAGADFVVTQLFFDVREYFELVDWLHDHGCDVPVIPGILPIQSFSSLRRVLSMCGASIPGKLFLELEEADKQGGNQEVFKRGVDIAVDMISKLMIGGAPGIHLYTLNKADLCLHIARECGFIR
ncbi:MAG: methylenetetrahydrofolate reductase [Desulfovibrionaceae bacterium]|nr:methylenetetrahydrofolate reductase [Desulfovibrionaceae bacterium]